MAFKSISKAANNPSVMKVANTLKKPITKAFSKTVEISASVLQRQKSNVKNLVCRIGDVCSGTKNSIGNTSVNFLGKEGIKKFKYSASWATKGSSQLIGASSKKNI